MRVESGEVGFEDDVKGAFGGVWIARMALVVVEVGLGICLIAVVRAKGRRSMKAMMKDCSEERVRLKLGEGGSK